MALKTAKASTRALERTARYWSACCCAHLFIYLFMTKDTAYRRGYENKQTAPGCHVGRCVAWRRASLATLLAFLIARSNGPLFGGLSGASIRYCVRSFWLHHITYRSQVSKVSKRGVCRKTEKKKRGEGRERRQKNFARGVDGKCGRNYERAGMDNSPVNSRDNSR